MIEFDDWSDVPSDQWLWPNFTPEEMACRGTRSIRLDTAFMDALQDMRGALGFPFIVGRGYSTEVHDRLIGGKGVHPYGCAVDIVIAGERAYHLDAAATSYGFTGKGIRQSGVWSKRIIHLDTLQNGDHPRPRLWSY